MVVVILGHPCRDEIIIAGEKSFEVGGPSKTFDQIKNIPSSYFVLDDIETGFGNRIPLWLFGFLY